MMLVRTFVAPSPIQGVGVFAAGPVRAGAAIWRFHERVDLVFTRAQLAAMPETFRAFLGDYAYPDPSLAGALVLNADDGRFMNHSDAPNATFAQADGRALADIPRGVEITCDYREFYPEICWERFPFLSG